MRVSYNGITSAFQADDGGSTPPTRSNFKKMTKDKNIAKKIFVSITGKADKDWQGQLKEINRRGITEAALFLEQYPIKQRRKIYEALER